MDQLIPYRQPRPTRAMTISTGDTSTISRAERTRVVKGFRYVPLSLASCGIWGSVRTFVDTLVAAHDERELVGA